MDGVAAWGGATVVLAGFGGGFGLGVVADIFVH